MTWLQGQLQRSKLVCHRKAQTANQLALTSPVAKQHSVDQLIRTERTQSVTDWANGNDRIFTNREYRHMG